MAKWSWSTKYKPSLYTTVHTDSVDSTHVHSTQAGTLHSVTKMYCTSTLGYGVEGWKFKKLLKDFGTGQFLCKNEF